MDDRGYLAEAFFEQLSGEGVGHRVMHNGLAPDNTYAELEVAVPREALARLPRAVGRFCQELDLRLVRVAQPEHQAWRFVVAWSDDVGRPRYIVATVFADWCRGTRRLLREPELQRGRTEVIFAHALLDAVEREALYAERDARLSALWHDDPRAVRGIVERFFPRPQDGRLIEQAARLGDWSNVRTALPALRRALHRNLLPDASALAHRLASAMKRSVRGERTVIALLGAPPGIEEAVRQRLVRDLAPAFPGGLDVAICAAGEAEPPADVRVVFDDPAFAAEFADAVAAESSKPVATTVAEIERFVLRWLECRVEREHPDALVGENPRSARLLQFLCRTRLPGASALELLLNCHIGTRLPAPVLMPHPFGIVVERGTVVGRRVTLMQQVTLGRKSAAEPGCPIIEDNVCIGPGARVLGPVRVGRGATIGANAVVTRDVPSHCTVVGANRILGAGQDDPASPQRDKRIMQMS